MARRLATLDSAHRAKIARAERSIPAHYGRDQLTGRTKGGPGPLLIYTDGSVSRVPIGGGLGVLTGWGYLGTDGRYGCGKIPQFDKAGNDPAAVTELRAVWHALSDRPITALAVVTDSQHASTILTGWLNGSDRMPKGYTGGRSARKGPTAADRKPTLEKLRDLVAANADRIIVEWVKGHAGNTLNEGADTLAQLGMRWARDRLDREDVTRRAAGVARGFLDQWRTE